MFINSIETSDRTGISLLLRVLMAAQEKNGRTRENTICCDLLEDSGTGAVASKFIFTFVSPALKRFHHLKTAARLIASSP
jgi:hypothetical protein